MTDLHKDRLAIVLRCAFCVLILVLSACPLSDGQSDPQFAGIDNSSEAGDVFSHTGDAPTTDSAPSDPVPLPQATEQDGRPVTDEEIAAILAVDSDGDGLSDLEELAAGGDPNDPQDGPDIDGDGIPNGLDSDVDGDGIENADDPDVDGDGRLNGFDDDIDSDGLLEADDDDDDGDGIPDLIDNDDNGDGEPDCDCDHGTCSAFGGLCLCEPGWEGESCDKFHCRDIRNCNNGTCVGPNTCRCNSGWEGVGSIPCAVYHCRELRNCNGHGMCVGPDMCQCDADWQGIEDCSLYSCDRNPALCDDGDPCTIDECDPRAGCSIEPVVCPLFEDCVNGTCTTACTNSSACDDGQGCRNGGCFDCEDSADCRDGDSCTIDECDPQSGCVNDPVPCPLFEECVRGRCAEACGTDGSCDSGFSCTDDMGCLEDCDDQNPCDSGDICDDGVCVPEDQEEDEE